MFSNSLCLFKFFAEFRFAKFDVFKFSVPVSTCYGDRFSQTSISSSIMWWYIPKVTCPVVLWNVVQVCAHSSEVTVFQLSDLHFHSCSCPFSQSYLCVSARSPQVSSVLMLSFSCAVNLLQVCVSSSGSPVFNCQFCDHIPVIAHCSSCTRFVWSMVKFEVSDCQCIWLSTILSLNLAFVNCLECFWCCLWALKVKLLSWTLVDTKCSASLLESGSVIIFSQE